MEARPSLYIEPHSPPLPVTHLRPGRGGVRGENMDTFTQTEKLLEKTYFCVDEAFEGFEIKSFLYSYLRYIPDAGYTWT